MTTAPPALSGRALNNRRLEEKPRIRLPATCNGGHESGQNQTDGPVAFVRAASTDGKLEDDLLGSPSQAGERTKMSTEPALINERSPEPHKPNGHQRKFFERVIDEAKKFTGITVYLWVIFGLFVLHERIVLEQYNINYRFYGFAIVNSLLLAKVMLVAEDLHLGERFKDGPLVYPILYKSVLFAIVFICFDVIEEVIVGVVKGKTIVEGLPRIGGGGLIGIILVGTIIAVALIPFFAYRGIGRVIGERELRDLLLTRGK
jgi:hypothetical protein